MTTARTLIADSLISLGEFDPTEAIDADALTFGLRTFNRMIGVWAAQNLLIPYTTSENFAGSGSASYTMGTAGTASTTRAKRILDAYANDGTYDYPIEIIDQHKYNRIFDKSNTSTRPFVLFYDPVYPVGVIYLYYVPSAAYTIYIESTKDLHSTLALATTVSLPLEYEEAIVLNLRNKLAPSYERAVTQGMRYEANEALRIIKNLNAANRQEEMELPIGLHHALRGGHGYNIETG